MSDEDLLIRPAAQDTPARALPANIEAEAAFIGAVLIDNRVIEELPTQLRPEHFFEPVHQRIFDRILTLLDRSAVVTPVTLKPYFEADEALKQLGGVGYLARLTGEGQGLLAPREIAAQIYDLALLRELVSVGRGLVEGALDTSEDVAPMEQIEKAEASLYKVAEGATGLNEAESFRSATNKALGQIQAAINSGGHVAGKTTGFSSVNEKIGGLHDSDLIIVAGRPGMGKTSLATNIAFNCADRYMRDKADGIEKSIGAPVAFFSLEMSSDQLATRILAEQAEISSELLRKGKISREQFQKLSFAAQRLNELPLYIDDTPALTISGLRTRARRMKRRYDIGLIVVDYLQLMQGTGRSSDNRVNEISEISRGLKTLAKELQVPVIALSQLSRQVESREDKRPQLADLRESGSIEQDADMVWFIFRAEYYHDMTKPDGPGPNGFTSDDARMKYETWEQKHEELVNRATLMIAKQRHGATGNVPMHFEREFTKFADLAPGSWGDYE